MNHNIWKKRNYELLLKFQTISRVPSDVAAAQSSLSHRGGRHCCICLRGSGPQCVAVARWTSPGRARHFQTQPAIRIARGRTRLLFPVNVIIRHNEDRIIYCDGSIYAMKWSAVYAPPRQVMCTHMLYTSWDRKNTWKSAVHCPSWQMNIWLYGSFVYFHCPDSLPGANFW